MKRSEIWLVNLDPTIGSEIRKTRPGIIVSSDQVGLLPLKVIVPLTDWKDRYSAAVWMVRLDPDAQNQLRKISAADCFQVRSISEQRLIRKLGNVSSDIMESIELGLTKVLALGEKGGL